MKRYRLERGDEVLGVITCGEWDGHQGSWHDWGLLELAPGSISAIELLANECHLHDEAARLELDGGDPAGLLAEADRLQAEFMGPGVVLVSLVDGVRLALAELHTEAERVYMR